MSNFAPFNSNRSSLRHRSGGPVLALSNIQHAQTCSVQFRSISHGPRGKAPGKLLIRMMRGEAGKHLGVARPCDHQPAKKRPRHSEASKWEERRPKKDNYFLAESPKCAP